MAKITTDNRLLKALSAEDFALLEPALSHVSMKIRTNLEIADNPIELIVFPDNGIVSVVATLAKNRQIEVGIIGRDGMTGIAVVLGDNKSPNETFVQVATTGWQIHASDLRYAISASPTLHIALLRYAHQFLIQTARTALVNGHSKIEERLARWLLMVQDRVGQKTVLLTHEFLATMLGARRPGVTLAIQMLEYRGLIRAKRSEITIIDRTGLIRLTNGGYGMEESSLAT